MVYREAEEQRLAKVKAREAVALAMQSKWEEAVTINRELLILSPLDLDANNRLGKALMETGDLDGSRAAFEQSLTIEPACSIARKNLERLSNGVSSNPTGFNGLSHKLFAGDSGKSAQVILMAAGRDRGVCHIASGSPVELRASEATIAVYSHGGQYLGIVPPKIGHRLRCMMDGGNRYEGVIVSSDVDSIRVLLHESYQHPTQRSKVSFLPVPAIGALHDVATESIDLPQPSKMPQTLEVQIEELVDLTILEEDGVPIEGAAVGGDQEEAIEAEIMAFEEESLDREEVLEEAV